MYDEICTAADGGMRGYGRALCGSLLMDWQALTHEELTEALEAGRTEATRRMQQLAALMGMVQPAGKRGRPPASTFRFGGADPEMDEDDASAAAQ